MMRHVFIYYYLILSLLALVACQPKDSTILLKEPSSVQNIPNKAEGLSLTIEKDIYYSPVNFMTITIENNSNTNFSYGEYFYIEKEVNGKWYLVIIPDSIFSKFPNFNNFGLSIDSHSAQTESFSLNELTLNLPPGDYRLSKILLSNDEIQNRVNLAVTFKIIN